MSDDYLWDRSGEPDADVVRLEQALRGMRQSAPPPDLDALRAPRGPRALRWAPFAAAAAIAVAGTVAWVARGGGEPSDAPFDARSAWSVAAVEGAPRVGRRAIADEGRLGVGQWLETDEASRARLEIPALGHVQVGPKSRLRLVTSSDAAQRIALARGSLEATTWAPPRVFFVETPTAVAADLGCRFTLDVDGDGSTRLRVLTGWVAFEDQGREAVVPKGATCKTVRGAGAGTPRFEDATAAFASALDAWDFHGRESTSLSTVLSEARARDSLTLWHLLPRSEGEARERVYDRLAALVTPPANATRDATLSLAPAALAAWKAAAEDSW
jgi:hypothetical protein